MTTVSKRRSKMTVSTTLLSTITLFVLGLAVLLQAISIHFMLKIVDIQNKRLDMLSGRIRKNELKYEDTKALVKNNE
jgi:hypothetical protein